MCKRLGPYVYREASHSLTEPRDYPLPIGLGQSPVQGMKEGSQM